MKKITTLLLTFLLATAVHAQSPNWLWAKSMGGTLNDFGTSIAVDASGNVYATGYFYGTVDFDPGAGTFNLTSAGDFDIFISKSDSSGNLVWAKAMGGTLSDISWFIAIDPAGSGDVYTTGHFHGTADFDPGSGIFNLTSNGDIDIFISKLDASGNFVWAKSMGGTNLDLGNSIAIDPRGNGAVYITGPFSNIVDFDPGPGIFNLNGDLSSYDIFISKLDTSGNFVWAKQMGGPTGSEEGTSIAIDTAGSGAIYTTGYFNGTADFDPGPGVFDITWLGVSDIFISKLDSAGNFVWAKQMAGTDQENGRSIVIDPAGSGDVYITGSFGDTVDFDPGPGVFDLISGSGSDIYISKLDSSGNLVWAKSMVGIGTYYDAGISIALDPTGSGDVYSTGGFGGTADFDPGAGVFNLTSNGDYDIFISKLDSSGNFVWAKQMGGISNDGGNAIAVNASGNVYMTGYFSSPSCIFDSTTLTNADSTSTSADIFIARLNTLVNTTGIDNVSALLNLTSVFPNPFSGSTVISFSLSKTEKVSLKIFDVNGRLVSTLAARIFGAGENEFYWNAVEVNTGIYFLRMETASYSENRKLIVTK